MFRPAIIRSGVKSSKCLSYFKRFNSGVQVEVAQGTIIGSVSALDENTKCYSFKGVPYAQPPAGHLRFQPPQPLDKFKTQPLDCSKERNVSFHKDAVSSTLIGSEDCLFLNIYTPSLPSSVSKKPRPVLIWIHGGAFAVGSGNSDFYSPEMLVQEDVIVITLNYRLGALGFASLPAAGVNGNNALKDQLMAMKWVQQNISQFGGDPNNVTLFGESAGASCIHLHLLSSNSRRFFHKAICQSGSGNMEWVMGKQVDVKTRRLAELMGCSSKSDNEILEFLRDPATKCKDIIHHAYGVLTPDDKRRGLPIVFKPVVEIDSEDAIVTKHPIESLKDPNSFDIPLMIGYNSDEGMIMLRDALKKIDLYDADLARMIPKSLKIAPDDPECQHVAEAMRKFYFNGDKLTTKRIPQFIDLHSDYNFCVEAVTAAELHSRNQHKSPQFFYKFSYDGDLNLFKKLFGFDKLKGACHGDEMYYLFKMNLIDSPVDKNSHALKVAKNMCQMWTNFAKFGNPTPDPAAYKWNPVQKTAAGGKFELDYLEIGEQCEMKRNPDNERMEFWREMFNKYNGSIFNPWI